MFRHSWQKYGDGSTAQIAIAQKPGFQPNSKIRCLVLGKKIFLVKKFENISVR